MVAANRRPRELPRHHRQLTPKIFSRIDRSGSLTRIYPNGSGDI